MMTTDRKPLSKTSINTLTAIARFRHQRRSGRVWLVGDKRISTAIIANLEAKAFVKEIALNGTPVLVLTDRGKQLVADVR
jgi:hypothetical protein